MSWVDGLAQWQSENTVYISVAFSWKLREAANLVRYWRERGYHVRGRVRGNMNIGFHIQIISADIDVPEAQKILDELLPRLDRTVKRYIRDHTDLDGVLIQIESGASHGVRSMSQDD